MPGHHRNDREPDAELFTAPRTRATDTAESGAPAPAASHGDGADAESWIARAEHELLTLDRAGLLAVFAAAVERFGPDKVLDLVLVPALDRIGDRWASGSASLSQVFMAGRYGEELVMKVLPQDRPVAIHHRVGVAVLEDHHLLGKRLVMAHLHAAGIAPVDLGHGMSAADLASRADREGIDVLLVSTLMLRAAQRVGDLVEALRRRRPQARVVVGGAPFRMQPDLWRAVGADAFGSTAADAPRLVAQLTA